MSTPMRLARPVAWPDTRPQPYRQSSVPYDSHVGRYSPQLAAALIAVAGVERGQRALDVDCGSGALAQALAALPGAEPDRSPLVRARAASDVSHRSMEATWQHP